MSNRAFAITSWEFGFPQGKQLQPRSIDCSASHLLIDFQNLIYPPRSGTLRLPWKDQRPISAPDWA